MSERKDGFSGRYGLVLAALGMAIGTGNIWRFPRVAAQYEGGAFLIPWLVFLFTWSIPILIAEFTLGKTTGRGPIGAFAKLLGKRAAWMGAFMAFVTLMIATYYSVVTGWTLKYFFSSLIDGLSDIPAATDPDSITKSKDASEAYFRDFAVRQPDEADGRTLANMGIPGSLWFHLGAVAIGSLIVWRGIKGGIERACKILIPALFVMLIGGTIWALSTLSGSEQGLQYFFSPKWELLATPKIWIDGLTQSAWSTGAGWGLILVYGAYARKDEDAVVTNRTAGLGNNTASLLAGLFIFPAVFALLSQAGMADEGIRAALAEQGPASSGLAFTYIPFIFKSMGDNGGLFTTLFFLGLFFAALSSLIALYEMSCRCFVDMGLSRGKAVLVVATVGAVIGGYSALDMRFFTSMDWVWGLALVIGGLAVAWAVQTYGADRYRRELINASGAQRKLGPSFNTFFVFLIPAQGIGMLGWWLYDAATNERFFGKGNDPWDPTVLGTAGIGPCVIWWLTALGIFWALSPWLGRWSLKGDPDGAPDDDEGGRPWLRPFGLVVAVLPWFLWDTDVSGFFSGDGASGDTGTTWWPWIAAGVGIVLVGGFIYNAIIAAFGGRSQEPDRPPISPTEVIGRDEEHA
ncbi:MAG: sodium-dependent transporter [Planctomycetes bacterium]|nr:sodium-dependent transporter [Planctomycetota bacterium]